MQPNKSRLSSPSSWPGSSRPSTSCYADEHKDLFLATRNASFGRPGYDLQEAMKARLP
jgi:hypothetical protein